MPDSNITDNIKKNSSNKNSYNGTHCMSNKKTVITAAMIVGLTAGEIAVNGNNHSIKHATEQAWLSGDNKKPDCSSTERMTDVLNPSLSKIQPLSGDCIRHDSKRKL